MRTQVGRFMAWASGLALLVGVALAVSASTADAKCGKFPATGQTTCWDSNFNVISCPGTGQDGDIQAGKTLHYEDNGDGTIKDMVTGLTWEKKSDDGSIHDKDTTYTWANAFAVHVAGLNTPPCFAGHCDWRLPNVKELQSIVDYENSNPAVASAFNNNCASSCTVLTCSCTAASNYWSASTTASDPDCAWLVVFDGGTVDGGFVTFTQKDVNLGGVRAVRGGCVD